jgi:prolyl oligopeptidase
MQNTSLRPSPKHPISFLSPRSRIDTSRQVLQKTLLQLHSLPSLAVLPQSCEEYYYSRVAGNGAVFPVTYRVKNPKLANIKNEEGLLEVSEKSHDEADDGGALVSSGFSRSGKYWAYSSSIKGSACVNIRIKDTVAGKELPDMLDDTKFVAKEMLIAWFGDVGFFYQFWPDSGKEGGPQLRFHRVGSKQIDDVVVFDDKKNSEHRFAVQVSEDDQLLLFHVFKGGRSHKLWAAKITPEDLMASFRPEFKFDIIISDIFDAEWRYVKFHRGKMLADEQIYVS